MPPPRFDPSQASEPMGLSSSGTSRRGRAALTRAASSEGADRRRADLAAMVSVVIPARNEAASLPQLVDEVARAFRALCERPELGGRERPGGFEIIVVDDGSTDGTSRVLEDLAAAYPELRPIRLEANVGQSSAIAAGFHAARGDWIATLDADLQNDPADLVLLWDELPGHDAALGWRVRREDTRAKRLISRVANRVRNLVLGQSIRDTGCSVRLFPRELARRLPLFHGVHRFFGPLLLREGCRIVQVPVSHRPRSHGRSHYNLRNRSLRVVVDLFGVAWLMHRPVRYVAVTEGRQGAVPSSFPVPGSDGHAGTDQEGRRVGPCQG